MIVLWPRISSIFENVLHACVKNAYYHVLTQFSSVQFSCSVVSNFLQPHESQHARLPCPSPTPRVHSDSRPSSQWCHSAISSSVVPFSSCLQSLPASESFPMNLSVNISYIPSNFDLVLWEDSSYVWECMHRFFRFLFLTWQFCICAFVSYLGWHYTLAIWL